MEIGRISNIIRLNIKALVKDKILATLNSLRLKIN